MAYLFLLRTISVAQTLGAELLTASGALSLVLHSLLAALHASRIYWHVKYQVCIKQD